MKAFNGIFAAVIAIIMILFAVANVIFPGGSGSGSGTGRPYRVEISRLVSDIEKNGLENIDLSGCLYVTGVVTYGDCFYDTESDYVIREINGGLYRFDYQTPCPGNKTDSMIAINLILGIMSVTILCVMLFIKHYILRPFEKLSDVPCELAKGNLTVPLKENKARFFGKFIWGIDMLRENMERQKQRELNLQREKKMLLLSLAHDIKTPLSAIKLYAKALSKGLYESRGKQLEIAGHISDKADEIDEYVSQITAASREDFLSLEVLPGEFYLSGLIMRIKQHYADKLSLLKINFSVGKYSDCIVTADFERSVEVLQNVMENAIKYGDGSCIDLLFSEEENCVLVTVRNSGCTLSQSDLPHMFESFWRGTNAEKESGSGLGLYICRRLMRKMDGEIFAEIKENHISVILAFKKA